MSERSNMKRDTRNAAPIERKSVWVLLAWIGAVTAVVGLGVSGLDFALRGRTVATFGAVEFASYDREPTRAPVPHAELHIPVEAVGKRHTVVLSTRPQELALRWTVSTPEGFHVADGRDLIRRRTTRRTDFVPLSAGRYVLRVEREASQPGRAGGWASATAPIDRVNVTVRVNDRSFLWRLSRPRDPLRWIPG